MAPIADFKLKPPDQHFATAEDVAKKLGISERRVRQLVEAGIFPKERHGQYDLRKIAKTLKDKKAKQLLRQAESAAPPGASAGENLGLEAERVKRVRVQRERDELRLARERGELIPIATYHRVMTEEYAMIRERLLSVPRIAIQLAGLSVEEMAAKLDEKIREVLISLSNGDAFYPTRNAGDPGGDGAGAGTPAPGGGPASDAQSVGMGGPAASAPEGQ